MYEFVRNTEIGNNELDGVLLVVLIQRIWEHPKSSFQYKQAVLNSLRKRKKKLYLRCPKLFVRLEKK